MARVRRQTDAAAHDDTVLDRHVRLAIARDQGIEAVFVAPEGTGGARAPTAAIVKRTHVAAGAEGLIAAAIQNDELDAGIILPGEQRRRDRAHHGVRQRIERPRAIHGNPPRPALAPDKHLISNWCSHAGSLDNPFYTGGLAVPSR